MLDEQAEIEAAQEQKQQDIDIRLFVCFKLAHEEYALDIQSIQEAIKEFRITPVPQMPEFCLGIINNRGSVIPVFDLRKKFHLDPKPFDANTRVLVALVDNITISLVVDEVLDNIKFETSKIDPAPTVRMKIEREYVEGLGEIDKRMIIILNLSKMHEFIKKEIADYQNKITEKRHDA